MSGRIAAIVTVGTELVSGLAVDTNTSEVALALTGAGVRVAETVSVADDEGALAATLRRLVEVCDLVVVTGGLGPTHDDITRAAAARAFDLGLVRDEHLASGLGSACARMSDPRAAEQVLSQADVLEGAEVLPAVRGTAPGQVVSAGRATVALLPGPPREMRPMLETLAERWRGAATSPRQLRCAQLSESDAQVSAQDALSGRDGIGLTVLAALGDVKVVLTDLGAGAEVLAAAADAVAASLGDACYSTDGSSLPDTVLALARERALTLATAESCTGGMVAAALTSVPGSSDVVCGGVVAYADDSKTHLLGVDPGLLAALGAVSDGVAQAMASGAVRQLGADLAIAVTGIAGPGGSSPGRPVGTVWFAIADEHGARSECRRFFGDREAVRTRSTMLALDLLRRALLER